LYFWGVLDEAFYLKRIGGVLMNSTKKEQVSSTINHMVHHRGQLTVYMRLKYCSTIYLRPPGGR